MRDKPIIGITLDSETSETYSKYPWYALRENYADAVAKYGAIPLLIPHIPEAIPYYLDLIDGLILTGGDFDIDPSFYGEKISSNKVTLNRKRTEFEMNICRLAINIDMPLLGICAGEQLINVVLGGTLIQHIPDSIENHLQHEQPEPKHKASHEVEVKKDSLLHKITGKTNFAVNSTHHQAVRSVGSNVIVNAIAPDLVIEGIEHKQHKFCLGVQWHPEYLDTDEDNKIFQAFIASTSA